MRFVNGLRVKITDEAHALIGETGTVVRLRISDNGAWVNMDRRKEDKTKAFPFPLDDSRSNHVLLYPEDCAKA